MNKFVMLVTLVPCNFLQPETETKKEEEAPAGGDEEVGILWHKLK